MSFLDEANLSSNLNFCLRVRQAMIKSAIAVMAEDVATPNHAKRILWANSTLLDPERNGQVMAMGIVTNGVITENSADNDIEFTVNSMIDAYAGM